MTAQLVLVGGGNMGAALLGGMIAAGWAAPDQLAVVEVLADRRTVLAEQFPGVQVADSAGYHDPGLFARLIEK